MTQPDLPEILREASLEEAERLPEAGEEIAGCRFFGESLPEMPGVLCEFTGCYFEKCTFVPCGAARLAFVDCVFEKCDFSGNFAIFCNFSYYFFWQFFGVKHCSR